MNRIDVIVVGGGAAGLVAAGVAAKQGAQVLLLERNHRMARKVMITGKGRCNITNNCSEESEQLFVILQRPFPVIMTLRAIR